MSIDAHILLAVPADKVKRRLVETGVTHEEAEASVRAIGSNACRVVSPFDAPDDEPTHLVAWVRDLVTAPLGHSDARGVLAFPEMVELRARSYDAAVRSVGRDGFWLPMSGPPTSLQSEAAPARKQFPRTTAPASFDPDARGPQFACLVIRHSTPVLERHPAAHLTTRLSDGTTLVIVKELFSSVEALVNLLESYYPELATDAWSDPGLLILRRGAHNDAARADSYDAVVRLLATDATVVRFEAPRGRPKAMWLRLDQATALRASFQAQSDKTWRA